MRFLQHHVWKYDLVYWVFKFSILVGPIFDCVVVPFVLFSSDLSSSYYMLFNKILTKKLQIVYFIVKICILSIKYFFLS